MSRFKRQPKQKSLYPRILHAFQKQFKQSWLLDKVSFRANRKKVCSPKHDFFPKRKQSL